MEEKEENLANSGDVKEELLKSIFELSESDNPEDKALFEELSKKFTEKIERFGENIAALPRKTRRSIKGYKSFSERYKNSIGLK